MSTFNKWILLFLSFFLVAFGQPAWIPINGLIASVLGYALFWRILLSLPSKRKRFFLSSFWFFAVQLIQLSWFISHPYSYIYAVYFLLALIVAVQFGVIGIFITHRNLNSFVNMLAIASLWTIFEWSRLFYFSGFSWNPSGMSLTSSLYAMQAASIGGVFSLSFWVILTNLLVLHFWVSPSHKFSLSLLALTAIAAPYLYGMIHVKNHTEIAEQLDPRSAFSVLLVQPAFPVEEPSFSSVEQLADTIILEWSQILNILKKQQNQSIDLIALPEYLVPLGTYNFLYPIQTVFRHFIEQFGAESLSKLPPLELPYCTAQLNSHGVQLLVNNAFWAQGIANIFNANLLIGLEDIGHNQENQREYYSAALFFTPFPTMNLFPERYEKRVLVPMGEYIPFQFFTELAASYGVFSSFTAGREAKVMMCNKILISPSICYEETFGHLIRESRQKGAQLMVNLTSDVWYPNSKLPRQHFDHARLRTVENGIPLIRACNTGVTGVIDSLGRIVAVLGGDSPEKVEWTPDSLFAKVPLYSYSTLYSKFGDTLIIVLSFLFLCLGFMFFGLIKKSL
jgi:apolipoprotein N-acyltransferase